jgi:hypothetical protein
MANRSPLVPLDRIRYLVGWISSYSPGNKPQVAATRSFPAAARRNDRWLGFDDNMAVNHLLRDAPIDMASTGDINVFFGFKTACWSGFSAAV